MGGRAVTALLASAALLAARAEPSLVSRHSVLLFDSGPGSLLLFLDKALGRPMKGGSYEAAGRQIRLRCSAPRVEDGDEGVLNVDVGADGSQKRMPWGEKVELTFANATPWREGGTVVSFALEASLWGEVAVQEAVMEDSVLECEATGADGSLLLPATTITVARWVRPASGVVGVDRLTGALLQHHHSPENTEEPWSYRTLSPHVWAPSSAAAAAAASDSTMLLTLDDQVKLAGTAEADGQLWVCDLTPAGDDLAKLQSLVSLAAAQPGLVGWYVGTPAPAAGECPGPAAHEAVSAVATADRRRRPVLASVSSTIAVEASLAKAADVLVVCGKAPVKDKCAATAVADSSMILTLAHQASVVTWVRSQAGQLVAESAGPALKAADLALVGGVMGVLRGARGGMVGYDGAAPSQSQLGATHVWTTLWDLLSNGGAQRLPLTTTVTWADRTNDHEVFDLAKEVMVGAWMVEVGGVLSVMVLASNGWTGRATEVKVTMEGMRSLFGRRLFHGNRKRVDLYRGAFTTTLAPCDVAVYQFVQKASASNMLNLG